MVIFMIASTFNFILYHCSKSSGEIVLQEKHQQPLYKQVMEFK